MGCGTSKVSADAPELHNASGCKVNTLASGSIPGPPGSSSIPLVPRTTSRTFSRRHILDEVLNELSKFDDRLCDVLRRGDIRLLRTSWLISQGEGYRIQTRQELEELERQGCSPSPLLLPEEAVALIRKCNRGAGALTYGWLLAGEPLSVAAPCL